MTFVRGSNPVWAEFDLSGHLFDDQFYMFVLDNEIPYAPLPTWQDPFGNVAWNNPIRFLANGTLPNNVYFDPDVVYRLEFRQGNTQSDPLVYLVENYVPGTSGDTPINETSFSTDNQISNPQFALINFTSPFTLNSISSQIIKVAPDWFLHLTGTGNVTLTQILLNSSVIDPTNASYALQIQLSGSWTNAFLSQRFNKNGVLWSNTFVSSSIMALSGNAPQNISAILVDSQGNNLTTVLNTTALTETFNEYPGVGEIGNSINTDFPPSAYIEYQLSLPNNCNITLTSVQLISGDVNITYPYEQTTIERQIDHTFHYYQPLINYKPISSLLTAWDFGLNPAQFGSSKSVTTTPSYVWDQTIMASAVNTVNITRFGAQFGAIEATTTVDTESFYLLQYLSDSEAVQTSLNNVSVNIEAYSLINPAVVVRVYLFNGNTSSSIPTLPTTIGTLAATGIFTLTAANWTAIPLADGYSNFYTLPLSAINNVGFPNFLSDGIFYSNGTKNFAIVVTFTCPIAGTEVIINSISCVPGEIPTRPAPQTADEVLRECQYYFLSTFPPGVTPADNAGLAGGPTLSIQRTAAGAVNPFVIEFSSPMRVNPVYPPLFYNPTSGAAGQILNITTGASYSSTSAQSSATTTRNGFIAQGTADAGSVILNTLALNWTVDARLGII